MSTKWKLAQRDNNENDLHTETGQQDSSIIFCFKNGEKMQNNNIKHCNKLRPFKLMEEFIMQCAIHDNT